MLSPTPGGPVNSSGISLVHSSCEKHIDTWYTESKYHDNFPYTSAGSCAHAVHERATPWMPSSPHPLSYLPRRWPGELSEGDGRARILVPQQAHSMPAENWLGFHRRQHHASRGVIHGWTCTRRGFGILRKRQLFYKLCAIRSGHYRGVAAAIRAVLKTHAYVKLWWVKPDACSRG